jgi:hypothetical protein
MDLSIARGVQALTIALPPWLGFVVMFVVCSGAFIRGGVEERLTAGGLLTNVAATVVLRDHSWPQLQRAGFTIDLLFLVLLLVIALRSPKFWPMAAAGFQLLAVLTHVAKMIDPALEQWAYITAIVIWTYLLMTALGVGVWNCWRAWPYTPSGEVEARVDTRR